MNAALSGGTEPLPDGKKNIWNFVYSELVRTEELFNYIQLPSTSARGGWDIMMWWQGASQITDLCGDMVTL